MKEHLYNSTIWIAVLVVVPLLFVNLFFDWPAQDQVVPAKKTLEDFETMRSDNIKNIDFHYSYLQEYFKRRHSAEKDDDLKRFYSNIAVDPSTTDYGHFGLGLIYLEASRIDSTGACLSRIQNDSLGFVNYAKAKMYRLQKNDSLYVHYLLKEAAIPSAARYITFDELETELASTEKLELLEKIRKIPDAKYFINPHLPMKIFFLNSLFLNYYTVVWEWFVDDINLVGIVAATLILMVWITYLFRLSFFEPVKPMRIIGLLLLGMLFSFLTSLISDFLQFGLNIWEGSESGFKLFLYTVFGIGAVEELVKIIPFLILLAFTKEKLQPYQYLLFASVSALGFAFIENLIYFEGDYGSIIHGRALTSAVGHMTFSSLFAYGIMTSAYNRHGMSPTVAFMVFWFLAALIHGLYDYFLFVSLILFFILFFFMIIRIWNTLINNAINNSENFDYNKVSRLKTLQFYLGFSLTAVLMFEYVIVGVSEGAEVANSSIIGAAFSGSFLIMFLGGKLSSLNVVKGYWAGISLSVNPFTDDVISQNFVGQKIRLSPYFVDRGLIDYFPQGVNGTIVRRTVLQNKEATFYMKHQDPEWFIVKLHEPIPNQEFRPVQLLIKFKEAHSSLNDKSKFLVHVLLVPKIIPSPKRMRKNFSSQGWAYLSSD